jgi:SAM-dependent methyltransferase
MNPVQVRQKQTATETIRCNDLSSVGDGSGSAMRDRLAREKHFYDELSADRSYSRRVLDHFSEAFYDKGPRGRLWSSFWECTDLRGSVVLDYGCGRGGFSKKLADLGAVVYGIDISPGILKGAHATAAESLSGSVQYLACDAHNTPFRDNSFDYVLGNGALHHLDLKKAYSEIARILKPGGKARFMEPMYHHPLLWSLRKLTPRAHTADEKALSIADLERAKQWFRVVHHREHFLFSVCAAPAHLLGRDFALLVVERLDQVDELLMKAAPRLRKFAWYTVLEMVK